MKFEAKAVAAEKSAAEALAKERKIVEKITQSSSQQTTASCAVKNTSKTVAPIQEKEQIKIESLENKEIEARKKLAQAHAKTEAIKADSKASPEQKNKALAEEAKAAKEELKAVSKVIEETKKIEHTVPQPQPSKVESSKKPESEQVKLLKKEQLKLEKLENKEIQTRIAAVSADEKWSQAKSDPTISGQEKLKIVQQDIDATKAAKAASLAVKEETEKIQQISTTPSKQVTGLKEEQVKLEKLENAELRAIKEAKIADAKLAEALKSESVSSEEKLELVNQDIAATKKVNEIQSQIKSETHKAEEMLHSQTNQAEKHKSCRCSGTKAQRRYIRTLKGLLRYLERYEVDQREYYRQKTERRGPCGCSH